MTTSKSTLPSCEQRDCLSWVPMVCKGCHGMYTVKLTQQDRCASDATLRVKTQPGYCPKCKRHAALQNARNFPEQYAK